MRIKKNLCAGDAAAEGERDVGGAQSGQGGEEMGESRGPRVQEHHPHTEGESMTRTRDQWVLLSIRRWWFAQVVLQHVQKVKLKKKKAGFYKRTQIQSRSQNPPWNYLEKTQVEGFRTSLWICGVKHLKHVASAGLFKISLIWSSAGNFLLASLSCSSPKPDGCLFSKQRLPVSDFQTVEQTTISTNLSGHESVYYYFIELC